MFWFSYGFVESPFDDPHAVARQIASKLNVSRRTHQRLRRERHGSRSSERTGELGEDANKTKRQAAGAAVNRKHVERRAALATMVFGGLRIGELCAEDADKAALKALIDGAELADSGRRADSEAEAAEVQQAA